MRRSVLAILLALCLASPAGAYRAGQTVSFHIVTPNLAGVATDPQVIKAYVYNGTACIDSTKGFGSGLSGIAALPLAGGKSTRVYGWTWTVPTNLASTSAWLRVVCRAVTSEIVQDWILPSPTLVPVNAATIDTLTADVTADLWSQRETSVTAVVRPGYYGATAVTLSGQPVSGAIVTLCLNSNGTNAVQWATTDASGNYVIPVSVSPTTSNVFYLWARRGVQVVKQAETVTVP